MFLNVPDSSWTFNFCVVSYPSTNGVIERVDATSINPFSVWRDDLPATEAEFSIAIKTQILAIFHFSDDAIAVEMNMHQ